MPGSPYAMPYRMVGMLAVIVSLMCLLGLHAVAAQSTSIYSLVPQNSSVAVSVDAPWLWKATTRIRNAGDEWSGAENDLGISFDRDLLPWVGQVGFALTGFGNDEPKLAIYLQIRDADKMLSSARVEDFLRNLQEDPAKVTWQSLDYKGVAVRRFEVYDGHSVTKVAMATVDNWLVIAIGDGVIRQVIDTQHGDIPSMAAHPSFSKAMAGAPANATGQFCVNGQGIAEIIQQRDDAMARQLAEAAGQISPKGTLKDVQCKGDGKPLPSNHRELAASFFAGTFTESGDHLQTRVAYCTTSSSTQATLKELRANAGTVSGASLTQLPGDTHVVLLIKNPDAWIGAMEHLLINAADTAEGSAAIQQEFSSIAGLRTVLQYCSGEWGIGVGWRANKGFGLTMAGEAATPENAGKAAEGLSGFMKSDHTKVVKANNLYTLPESKSPGVLVCWSARQQWLVGGSHPEWIAPATKPLTLPEGSNDAILAAFGDYTYLPHVLKFMGVPAKTLKNIDTTKLGQWVSSMKIEEDGSAVRLDMSESMQAYSAIASVLCSVIAESRGKERLVESLGNLKELMASEKSYTRTHAECLPMIKTSADIRKFLNVPQAILTSPRTKEAYAVNPSIAGKPVKSFTSPATVIVFYERTPGLDGTRCVVFLDGHTAVIPAARWEAYKKRANLP
ncbi:MAG TPA: DUF3352 domain-containing protein [Armatimonadota bacterium]|nr:DUF3352 domain-containing protein [Armatimonadota bacterium]